MWGRVLFIITCGGKERISYATKLGQAGEGEGEEEGKGRKSRQTNRSESIIIMHGPTHTPTARSKERNRERREHQSKLFAIDKMLSKRNKDEWATHAPHSTRRKRGDGEERCERGVLLPPSFL